MIKSNRMGWACRVHSEDGKYALIFIGMPEGMETLGRPNLTWRIILNGS
jgi:hypothetical protein